MTSSTRRSWITGSLREMLRKEDSSNRKKSEWYLHPNLEAEGAVVRAHETEENMADSLSSLSIKTNNNFDVPETPGLAQKLSRLSSQSGSQTPTQGGGGGAASPEPVSTPERPP